MLRKFSCLLALCLCFCLATSAAFADSITITVAPSLAPNAFGSPSFGDYQTNAITALGSGLSSYGDPNSPSYYSTINGPISVASAIVTGFPSWKGVADPSGAYAGEYGNRVHFGFDAKSNDGTLFSIDRLGFNAYSSDASNSLGFGYGPGSYGYSNAYIGINYGADGIKGTGDDIIITSGPASQLVNEIIGRGSGNSWAVYSTDPGATNQDKINNGANAVWAGVNFVPMSYTGTYFLAGTNATGSGTVLFDRALDSQAVATPLPNSALGGVALLGLFALRHWRKRAMTL